MRLRDGELWTYKQWADLMKSNFEKLFWIPLQEKDDASYVIEKKLVSRRGIYKDVLGATHKFTEY